MKSNPGQAWSCLREQKQSWRDGGEEIDFYVGFGWGFFFVFCFGFLRQIFYFKK